MFKLKRRGIVVSAVTAALFAAGCSSPATKAPITPGLGNNSVSRITEAARLTGQQSALDAVPAPDGSFIYFTVSGEGQGIFKTTSDPDKAEAVPSGKGFTALRGLAVSTDGERLYATDGTQVVSLASGGAGGDPVAVAGTQGTDPQGVEIHQENGGDVLFLSGKDPADGQPGVFKVPAAGGELAAVAKGAPLVKPDGVAVSGNGEVFVSDHGTAADKGVVYRIDSFGPTEVATGITLGDPAGVALTEDEKVLLISSLDPEAGTAQVVLVELETGKTGVVDKVIGENRSAGGLHRAHLAAVMGWADVQRPGRVYRVDP